MPSRGLSDMQPPRVAKAGMITPSHSLVDCINLTRLALVTGQVACPLNNNVRLRTLAGTTHSGTAQTTPARNTERPDWGCSRPFAQHPEAVTEAYWTCPSPPLHCSSLDAAEGRAGAEARLRDASSIRGEAFLHTTSIRDVKCADGNMPMTQYSMHDNRIVYPPKH
jgi:hypothetical protein